MSVPGRAGPCGLLGCGLGRLLARPRRLRWRGAAEAPRAAGPRLSPWPALRQPGSGSGSRGARGVAVQLSFAAWVHPALGGRGGGRLPAPAAPCQETPGSLTPLRRGERSILPLAAARGRRGSGTDGARAPGWRGRARCLELEVVLLLWAGLGMAGGGWRGISGSSRHPLPGREEAGEGLAGETSSLPWWLSPEDPSLRSRSRRFG